MKDKMSLLVRLLRRLCCFLWGHRWRHVKVRTWRCAWCPAHAHSKHRPDRYTWWVWRWARSRTLQVNGIILLIDVLNVFGAIDLPWLDQAVVGIALAIANMVLRAISSESLPSPRARRVPADPKDVM